MNPVTAVPLSSGQQSLWLDESLRGESAVYNVPVAYEIRGALDTGALAQALTSLLARHPALRSSVRVTDGEPSLVTAAPGEAPLEVRDPGRSAWAS
ncbi:hypothetical protein PL81_11605, partial [Streptomyces sp. RSD-27]